MGFPLEHMRTADGIPPVGSHGIRHGVTLNLTWAPKKTHTKCHGKLIGCTMPTDALLVQNAGVCFHWGSNPRTFLLQGLQMGIY